MIKNRKLNIVTLEKSEKKNIKWILIVSIIQFFILKWWYFLGVSFSYSVFDFWFLIYLLNILSTTLSITFASLHTTNFLDRELIHQLTIFFFILSMSLFFISNLELIFNTYLKIIRIFAIFQLVLKIPFYLVA